MSVGAGKDRGMAVSPSTVLSIERSRVAGRIVRQKVAKALGAEPDAIDWPIHAAERETSG